MEQTKAMRETIYISGRITGEDYKQTIIKFCNAESQLITQGYTVVNPMKVKPFLGLNWWICYMISDLWKLRKCSIIYMLPDWSKSRGACIEHLVAVWNKKEIIYEHNTAGKNNQ